MDLLSKRYASPCFLLDGMIHTCRLCEFVDELMHIDAEEKEEQVNWDFFLHKVWGGSYKEFHDGIETNKKNQQMSERVMETTIQNSMDILHNFHPVKGGE